MRRSYISQQPTVGSKLSLTSADQLVDRGLIYMNSGKFDEALADFTQALKLESDNKWALADRALAKAWLNHFEDAEKDLAALEARDADNPVGLRARGLVAELKRECGKAVGYYVRSLAKEPDNNFALGHKAMCEASLSKNEDALADSTGALKADPAWMDLRVMRANVFLRRGANADVVREAELLTSENPRSAYAFVAAGKIYARLARTRDAMKAFDTALGIEPDPFVYLNRAQARPFTDHAGRMADLDTALKLDPNNTDALAEKAEQLAVEGNLKEAKAIYDRVIGAEPDARYYKTRRAVVLFKIGAVEESRKEFAQLRAQAKSANEFNSLCWAKATGGILLDLALEECHEALRREPESGAYLDSLALVQLRLGHVDEAITDYTRAIIKNTGAASYMGRALAYAQKGNQALASADRKQALQLDPDTETRFAEFGLAFAKAGATKAPAR